MRLYFRAVLIFLLLPIVACGTVSNKKSDDLDTLANVDSTTDSTSDSTTDSTSDSTTESSAELTLKSTISSEELSMLLSSDRDVVLMNVVDEEFYDLGQIGESLIIPWDLLEDRLDEIPSYDVLVLYCRKGVRSASAYDILMDHEFENVTVLEGGIEAWTAAGYEVNKIPL
ncbi:MAG: rhodanese-like domain-containing protein [Deltaproteobacteria bacterium]|nr:rhodanese-like domain-containing protein [Deltaproteobacteria bacterium]